MALFYKLVSFELFSPSSVLFINTVTTFIKMESIVNQVIYLVGLVVVVLAILSFVGIHV
jgi:hypothetical protein